VPLQGNIDFCDGSHLEGWAFDDAQPASRVRLEIRVDGHLRGSVLAGRYRADLARAGCFGDGHCSFALDMPVGLSRGQKIEVCRADDGAPLPGSPVTVSIPLRLESKFPVKDAFVTTASPASAIDVATDSCGSGAPLEGNFDFCDGFRLSGWAFDRPQGPGVNLEIRIDGELIGSVLARHYRADLARFGGGYCGFSIDMPVRLGPGTDHVIEICRADDGAPLPGSPKIIPALSRFDAEYLKKLAEDLQSTLVTAEKASELDEAILFLGRQTEALLATRARLEGAAEVVAQPYRRWGDLVPAPGQVRPTAPAMRPQALFIDDAYPLIGIGSNGGSNAALDHMRSLRRLGFDVSFVASGDLTDHGGAAAVLSAFGITALVAPWYSSVEEVLRRLGQPYNLVYLHRVQNAWTYHALVRRYCPRASIVYGVADLHHLRLARQAQILGVPSYAITGRLLRMQELFAAQVTDVVITHSSVEAELLRQVPNVKVAVVPFSAVVRSPRTGFSERSGIAFIGGFAHDPNLDAVYYLAEKIVPLVHESDPSIRFRVIGGQRERLGPSLPPLEFMGEVDNLDPIFDAVRLTVAPLRFGAGLKSKVIESLAAGVPCIGTSIAYEGMTPPDVVRGCIADTPAEFAAALLRLYDDEGAYADCSKAGRLYIQNAYSEARVDTLMREAVAPALRRWERASQDGGP